MKNLLPRSIAAQAMVLLVVGLAFTHLVSNLFYATDRESALLTSGGEHAILWVATVGALAETLSPQEWSAIAAADGPDRRFVTITPDPVVATAPQADWHEASLQRELSRHVPPDRLEAYRIAYASAGKTTTAATYWRNYFAQNAMHAPDELILVSLRLDNGNWLNVATPVQPSPSFFSYRLGLSMAVMLIAVVLISFFIVGRMVAPLRQLSRAAEKLGTDVQAPAIPETGPEEVQRTARAFNVMQRRIRRFVEDRTQMLGAIAHDLGTPITRLRLRAEFIEDAELRAKMLRDLDDMQQMVASTLSFIREEATSEPQATVDIGSLLRRVCDDMNDAGELVELRELPRWVLLDCRPTALRRALGNLIGNALKYGGAAEVSLSVEPEKLLILIDDNGPGIPEDRQEDVFQPFYRLEDSRNRETGGTGLGLAVARTIIRAHGGDIKLSNRSAGGLRARISLPRSKQSNEHEDPHPAVDETRGATAQNGKKTRKVSAQARSGANWRKIPGHYSPSFGEMGRLKITDGTNIHVLQGGTAEWKTR
ncbi:MAG TPA: HAMP domain-containing protein [Devosia sp.]|nr:HAMP domain-containing protein [Devosia sp.]